MAKAKDYTSTEIKTQIDGIRGEIAALDNAKKKLGNQSMDILKELINRSDSITAVRWAQYTPYFNDGDSCEFGVQDIEFKFSEDIHNPTDKLNKASKVTSDEDDEEEDEDNDDESFVSSYSVERFLEERKDILNYKEIDDVRKLCADLEYVHSTLMNMDNALRDLFGDHIQVTVTRQGVETEEYSHD